MKKCNNNQCLYKHLCARFDKEKDHLGIKGVIDYDNECELLIINKNE